MDVVFDEAIDLLTQTASDDASKLEFPRVITNQGDLAVAEGKTIRLKAATHLQSDGANQTNDLQRISIDDILLSKLGSGV